MELDSFLFPKESPYNDNRTTVNSFDFNSDYDRNTVTTQKIRDFSFNNGQGGTLTLGGQNNGNGILRVLDNGGTQRVAFGNTGGTITNGNLVLLNDSAGTTLDNKGVVNQTLLTYSAATRQDGGTQAVIGTVPTVFTNGTLSIVVERQQTILFLADIKTYNLGTQAFTGNGHININGAEQERWVELYSENTGIMTDSIHTLAQLSAGTHSYTLSATPSSAGTIIVYGWRMSYVIIGS